MSDRVFFPLILLAVLAMVALALRPAAGALPTGSVSGGGTDYSEIIVSGDDLNRVIGGGESDLELIGAGDIATLRIETEAGMLGDDPVKGPHFRLAADLENVFQGRTVDVILRVKPSDRYGAMAFVANYATGKDGESGWTEFALQPDYADYTLTFDVPLRTGAQAVDYLAIRPVTPEKRRAIEIEKITFRPGPRWAEPPA